MLNHGFRKEDFERRMRAKGYSDEEIDKLWPVVEKVFLFFILQTAYDSLPDDIQRQIAFGFNPDKIEDLPKFVMSVAKYVKENPGKFEVEKVVEKALVTLDKYYDTIKIR